MKRIKILDIILSCAVLALIAFTLLPAVARMQRTKNEATCQSNMRRIGQALELYSNDNSNRYPSQHKRIPLTGQWSNSPTSQIPLSDNFRPLWPHDIPANRFQYGLNWVEAIYTYLVDHSIKTDTAWVNYYKCPKVTATPDTSVTPVVSYAMNLNMLKAFSLTVRNPSKVMMLREMDICFYSSPARPYQLQSIHDNNSDVFLNKTDTDVYMRSHTNNDTLHSNGSHILLADGHVKWFGTDYYPVDGMITIANSYDTEMQQWYNFSKDNTSVPEVMRRSIAISP